MVISTVWRLVLSELFYQEKKYRISQTHFLISKMLP